LHSLFLELTEKFARQKSRASLIQKGEAMPITVRIIAELMSGQEKGIERQT
jgi:hypothetical protein